MKRENEEKNKGVREKSCFWVRSFYLSVIEEDTATHCGALTWRKPIDRAAWLATVYGMTKSWTWLKQLSTCACAYLLLRSKAKQAFVNSHCHYPLSFHWHRINAYKAFRMECSFRNKHSSVEEQQGDAASEDAFYIRKTGHSSSFIFVQVESLDLDYIP